MVNYFDPEMILTKHPTLIETVIGGGVRLTLEGRLFVITLLMKEKLLTQENFSAITNRGDFDGQKVYQETAKLLADKADEWISLNDDNLEHHGQEKCIWTDLNYQAVGVLMWVLLRSQKNYAASLILGR